MPSITYNLGIPLESNNPSVDQPNMKTNTDAVNSWTDVDHYKFSDGNAGTHKQVTFPANGTAGSPSGLASTVYTAPGTADSAKSQLYFKNSLTQFPVSVIKAFAYISNSGAVLNGFGITNATFSSGSYTVNMSYSLPSGNFIVFALGADNSVTGSFLRYNVTALNQFVLIHSNTATQGAFGVAVLQI